MARLKTNIVTIGNSQGIRIPKTIIKQCHLKGEVELEPKGNCLVVKSKSKSRNGWEKAFQKMTKNKDDKLLDSHIETRWDKKEWKW